jgi:PEP-CTERM motif
VATVDSNGVIGNPASNYSTATPTSWTILTTTGTIQTFSASAFTINTANFENGAFSSSNFSLSVAGGDQLILNFTPVPEPSTWALLGVGVCGIAVAGIRRRRATQAA